MTRTQDKVRYKMMRYLQILILVTAAFGLSACVAQFRNHGYVPSEEQLSEILPGIDSRDTVADVIGQPTAGGVTNSGGFYYVQSRFRHYGPLEPQEVDRQIVAILFDTEDLVSDIARLTLEDGRVISLNRRVTDNNVSDATFLRQILGNFGQVDAETLLNGPGG